MSRRHFLKALQNFSVALVKLSEDILFFVLRRRQDLEIHQEEENRMDADDDDDDKELSGKSYLSCSSPLILNIYIIF